MVVRLGPSADVKLGPIVVIGRRQLPAAERRESPDELLRGITAELMQSLDGFETVSAPAEATVAGIKGVVVKAKINETLPAGGEIERRAQLYGVATHDEIWFVRCTLPADEAFDADVTAILASIAIEPI